VGNEPEEFNMEVLDGALNLMVQVVKDESEWLVFGRRETRLGVKRDKYYRVRRRDIWLLKVGKRAILPPNLDVPPKG
jgi:hypothetical protein